MQLTRSSHCNHDFEPDLPKADGLMRQEIHPNGDYRRGTMCVTRSLSHVANL